MSTIDLLAVVGGIIGYVSFVFYLESSEMGNIIIRDDTIVPSNVLRYMKSPFVESYLWYPALWRANWLITTGIGMLIGKLISYVLFNYI